MQKLGYVKAVPSYEVAPLNGYSGLPCTSASNHTRAALVPSAQWPAVSTSVGDNSDALQRWLGEPFTSNTANPTYGWLLPSGVPLVMPKATPTVNRHSTCTIA